MTTTVPEVIVTPGLPDLQVAELYRTLGAVRIADSLGLWNQDEWAEVTDCGTAGCFAGHLAFQHGYTKVHDRSSYAILPMLINPITNEELPFSVNTVDGSEEGTVASYAREALGLTRDEAELLFHPDISTIEDLEAVLDNIIESRRALS